MASTLYYSNDEFGDFIYFRACPLDRSSEYAAI